MSDLVKKDTDLDGIPDWEESLYGTDINKKDTNEDGVLDSEEIAQKRILKEGNDENLTETDKFSRELLATVAALNQVGEVDQDTVDKISTSLIEKIQNPVVRKIYLLSDIKIIEDNSYQAVKKYRDNLLKIYEKYPDKKNVTDILKDFINDGENTNIQALNDLDPILKNIQGIINERIKMNTPSSLAELHLSVINGMERLLENLTDLKSFDTDPVIAMGAINQYENNLNSLQSSLNALANLINKKLNN